MRLTPFVTTVTPLSKALAMFLFISLPFVGLYIGYQYGKSSTTSSCLPCEINKQKDTVNTDNSKTMVSSPTSADSRKILTSQNAHQENTIVRGGMSGTACDEDFSQVPANDNVVYRNTRKGIEILVPYNNSWGSNNYRINPYDEEESGISFGRFVIGEGCSWYREYSLKFEAKKTKEEVKQTVVSNAEAPMEQIKEYSLQNMPVLMWPQDGPGCHTNAVFFGPNHNYRIFFVSTCEPGRDLKTLKMIASKIKLI